MQGLDEIIITPHDAFIDAELVALVIGRMFDDAVPALVWIAKEFRTAQTRDNMAAVAVVTFTVCSQNICQLKHACSSNRGC